MNKSVMTMLQDIVDRLEKIENMLDGRKELDLHSNVDWTQGITYKGANMAVQCPICGVMFNRNKISYIHCDCYTCPMKTTTGTYYNV